MVVRPVSMRELCKGFAGVEALPRDLVCRGVTYDSRMVRPGVAFVAIQGEVLDGNKFIPDVIRRGASCIVTEKKNADTGGIPVVVVGDSRLALSALSARFFSDPSSKLNLTGVTGTNGKTSVCTFIRQLLEGQGHFCGQMGTISTIIGDREIPAMRTTPESPELQENLAEMVRAGCSHAAIEVSSHALSLHRVTDLHFHTAVFTNLSPDHLDFHGDMETYFEDKRRLFGFENISRKVIGVDDEWGQRLVRECGEDCLRFGLDAAADITAENLKLTMNGTRARLRTPWWSGEFFCPTPGRFNVANVLAAIAAVATEETDWPRLLQSLAEIRAANGRMEILRAERGAVVVDYAHTPDALAKALAALEPLCEGKLMVVFGCGGDRDRLKRPLMVREVGRRAERMWLTQDNPRTEDPDQIFEDMKQGLDGFGGEWGIVPDRRKAIYQAVSELSDGDVLLVAGKGHETYQDVNHVKMPFDDREVVCQALAETGNEVVGDSPCRT